MSDTGKKSKGVQTGWVGPFVDNLIESLGGMGSESPNNQELKNVLVPMLNYLGKYLRLTDNEPGFNDKEIIGKIVKKINDPSERQVKKNNHLFKEVIEKRHRKEFGKPLDEIVSKAQQGDKRALFRLIKFDINFLFEEWIQGIIVAAWIFGDSDFLRGLGKSIQASHGPFGKVHNSYFRLIGLMVYFGLIPDNAMDKLHDILYGQDIFKSADFQYFLQMLRRHGMRSPQRANK